MNINQVIKKALITEKTMVLAQQGKYTFVVDKRADKKMVKNTIEALFPVEVKRVRLVIVKGKKKRVGPNRRRIIKESDWKKAILELKSGQKIDIFEEIKTK